ncbi:hypothetical protein HYT00_01450 [Candidatus Giovannonibacteria bacterium]|nr:hypothetical protein [Candidatus Giovannonibacteria bacterium]
MQNIGEINIAWSESELLKMKGQIVRRVHFSWFLRKVVVPGVLVLAVSGAVIIKGILDFHVSMIVNNTLSRLMSFDLFGLLKYLFVAFQKTELDMLAMLVASSLLALYFGRRLAKETFNFMTRGTANPLTRNVNS